MKKKVLIICLFLLAIIYGGVQASASEENMLKIFFNIKEIRVDGKSMVSDKQPFINNGTAYLPLRFISEALGRQVIWDADAQTIDINSCSRETVIPDENKKDKIVNIEDVRELCFYKSERIILPADAMIAGVLISVDVDPKVRPFLPAVNLKRGNSQMIINSRGVVIKEVVDPNEKEPFAFLNDVISVRISEIERIYSK